MGMVAAGSAVVNTGAYSIRVFVAKAITEGWMVREEFRFRIK